MGGYKFTYLIGMKTAETHTPNSDLILGLPVPVTIFVQNPLFVKKISFGWSTKKKQFDETTLFMKINDRLTFRSKTAENAVMVIKPI